MLQWLLAGGVLGWVGVADFSWLLGMVGLAVTAMRGEMMQFLCWGGG